MGDCCDMDAARTRWNSTESVGNEIVDENKALIFNWKEIVNVALMLSDRFRLHRASTL